MEELHQCCPICRGICTCRKCLRVAKHVEMLPPPTYSEQQRQRHGRYLLRLLGPSLAQLLDQQEHEVREL